MRTMQEGLQRCAVLLGSYPDGSSKLFQLPCHGGTVNSRFEPLDAPT